MGFVVKNYIDESEIKTLCDIDKSLYSKENCVSIKTCKSWYKVNPFIYTVICDGDKIIGYINFCPITDKCYKLHSLGLIKDSQIKDTDILPFSDNASFHCLFMSVAIKKDYQNSNALYYLMQNFYMKINRIISEKHIKIKSIIADVVNEKIEKFVLDNGFKQIIKNDNCNIYEGNIF